MRFRCLQRSVGGAVINEDEFEVAERLRGRTFTTTRQVRRAVVGNDDDGNKRFSH